MYSFIFFFFNDTATTEIYTLSLHDALPICATSARSGYRSSTALGETRARGFRALSVWAARSRTRRSARLQNQARRLTRSEEHTSELQSPCNLVCRLLLEKKKNIIHRI